MTDDNTSNRAENMASNSTLCMGLSRNDLSLSGESLWNSTEIGTEDLRGGMPESMAKMTIKASEVLLS